MLEGATIEPATLPGTIPPAPAVMAILNRFNRDELGNAIEVLVALLDIWDGDPDALDTNDAEDDFALTGLANAYAANKGPGCFIADVDETAYVEWDQMAPSLKGVRNIAGQNEDDEDDDPAGQSDEDGVNTGTISYGWHGERVDGPGCPISDPGGCEHDGREPDDDAEDQQMQGDVPALPVYSADYNIFSEKRTCLGISNLMSSFVCGDEVRSADSGNRLTPLQRSYNPGVPV